MNPIGRGPILSASRIPEFTKAVSARKGQPDHGLLRLNELGRYLQGSPAASAAPERSFMIAGLISACISSGSIM